MILNKRFCYDGPFKKNLYVPWLNELSVKIGSLYDKGEFLEIEQLP